MSTVNAETVIAALDNIAAQLEGKTLASVKVATTRRRVKSLTDQIKNQAVEPATPETEKVVRPLGQGLEEDLEPVRGWVSLVKDDHTMRYRFTQLPDGKLRIRGKDGIVVKRTEAEFEAEGWVVEWDLLPVAQRIAVDKDIRIRDLDEVDYNRMAQAFYEATSGPDIRYANMLVKPTIVEGLKAAIAKVR